MEGNHKAIYKDYYKVLEIDYDATDEDIKLNYRRLALKWHPDKHKGDDTVTSKFQEINEAYKVLSDPGKRLDYDLSGNYEIEKYTLRIDVVSTTLEYMKTVEGGRREICREYLSRFKGMILTCNGLGISHTSIWSEQLIEAADFDDEAGLNACQFLSHTAR